MKFINIIFVILVVLIIGEISYYLYSINSINKKNNSPAFTTNTATQITGASVNTAVNPLISAQTMEYLQTSFLEDLAKVEKSNNRKFYITEENSGYVGEIVFDEKNRFLRIKIIDEKGQEVISYRIPEKFIPTKQFWRISQGVKTSISYTDIANGDKIMYRSIDDLVNTEKGTFEFIIEK